MTDPGSVAVIAGTFLLAGTVKGVIGLGLPTVSLAVLALALDLPTAMALMLVPSLVTNLWQAAVGGHGRAVLRRLWPYLLAAAATVWIGALALTRVELSWLTALLGAVLVLYAVINLAGARLPVARGHEPWIAPLAGAANGVLTGMTGTFVVPGVMYLQAIGLSRDALVQAMGMLFTVLTLALAVALQRHAFLTGETGALSLAALLPALLGMALGQRIRRRLSERRFRSCVFVALLLLGGYIMAASLGG